MALPMTTAQYAAFTSNFDRYRQVYEMFAGNTDAQYEVFSLDHLSRTITRLEYELAQRRGESRRRLDSLLDHDADGGQFLRTLFLEHTSSLSDRGILSTSSSSYNPHDPTGRSGTRTAHLTFMGQQKTRNEISVPVSSPPQSPPLPRHTSLSGTKENPIVVEDGDDWAQISATRLGETSRILTSYSSHSLPISTPSDPKSNPVGGPFPPLPLSSPFQIQGTSTLMDGDGDDDDGYLFCSYCLHTGHSMIYCSQYECDHCRLLAPGHKANDCQYLFRTN